jgi:ABC-type xylose transport system substrate-binding protein
VSQGDPAVGQRGVDAGADGRQSVRQHPHLAGDAFDGGTRLTIVIWMQRDGRRLGIDFGTSSTVAVLRGPDGRSTPILFGETPVLPSAVCADGDRLLAGRDALHLGRSRPEHLEPNPKRRIDEGVVLLGAREVPVAELIAAVLLRAREEADRVADGGGETVLTCPAGWGPRRRAVLREAATRAGLDAVTLIAEPVAAASYFVHVLGNDISSGNCLLVYDFGAGTFDASVVRRTGDGFTVLAEEGLPDAGGLDVDAAIVSYLGAVYATRAPAAWSRLTQPASGADLRAARQLWQDVRDAKEMLSRSATTSIHLPLLEAEVPLGREQLEHLARPVLDRTVAATRAALRVAGVGPGELTGVFLVGGSSRIPLVATLLHRALGIAPTAIEQPELVVAGGSLHAPQDAALAADPVLATPVAPAPPPVPAVPPVAPPVAAPAPAPVSAGPFTPVSAAPVSPAAAPVSPAAGLFGETTGQPVPGPAAPLLHPQAPIGPPLRPPQRPTAPPARSGQSQRTIAAVAAVAVLAVVATVVALLNRGDNGSPGSGNTANGSTSGTVAFMLRDNVSTRWTKFDKPSFAEAVRAQCPACKVLDYNAGQDAAKQLAQTDEAIAAGAKVLVVTAVDAQTAVAIVRKAKARNVPVIAYDALIRNAPIDYYVSYQYEAVGRLQGEALVKKMTDDGTIATGQVVMINGSPTDEAADRFKKGAHEALDGKVRIGKEYDTPDWNPAKARTQMEQAITALGKDSIKGVYAANDGIAGAASAAMSIAGFTTIPPLTGQDAELSAIQRIIAGQQYMTVYKGIRPEATAAADLAVQLLKGERPTLETSVDNGAGQIPAKFVTPVVVTAANVNDTVVKDGLYTAAEICTAQFAAGCNRLGLS